MMSESQTSNGSNLRRTLQRTLTLPLSKMKSRGGSFMHRRDIVDSDIKCDVTSDSEQIADKHIPPKRDHLSKLDQSMRNPTGHKKDIRVSRINPNTSLKENGQERFVVDADTGSQNHLIDHTGEKVLMVINEDRKKLFDSNDQEKRGKKKRPRHRRWPTQTLARVLDVPLLKRLGSVKKNEHAATVLRTVTVNRNPGDILGIYIKEVKRTRPNGNEGASTCSRILISRLAPGSISEKQGILKRGDEVILVNGSDISQLPLREVGAMMDCHRQLVLSVRSKHISVNNNNNVAKTEHPCLHENTLSDAIILQKEHTGTPAKANFSNSINACGVGSMSVNLQVPKPSSNSLDANSCSREEVIPSVYDNNFPSSLVSVPATEVPAVRVKRKVEVEYDEAFQILLNAINSFEKPRRSPGNICRGTESTNVHFHPGNYWSPLNEIISNSSEERSITTHPYLDNDNISAASDSTNTSMSTTPLFPSVSELPFDDEVPPSENGDAPDGEVQVQGCARLFSPYPRSNSLSSSTTESIHSIDGFPKKEDQLKFSYPQDATSQNIDNEAYQQRFFSAESSPDDVKFFEPQPTPTETNLPSPGGTLHTQDSLHRINVHGVTVRQYKEWFNKGKEVSLELRTRIEGGLKGTEDNLKVNKSSVANATSNIDSVRQHSKVANTAERMDQAPVYHSDDIQTSESSATGSASPNTISSQMSESSADKSPVERSPKILFKISSTSKQENPINFEKSTTESSESKSPPIAGVSAKTFWNIVASPPRLRKSKFSKKITKRKKKSVDWDTNDSSYDGSRNDPTTVVDRYHLDPGEEQNRRLSRQFLPDNRPRDPSIKPINMSEFKKYKPPLPNSGGKYSQIPIEGSLVITLYGARDIKKTVSEVYCITQVDDDVKHRIKTPMQPCRGSVAWNECYEAKLEEAYDLHITLYTWESHGKHKVLAKSTLPVSDLLCGQGVPIKLAVKLDPRGTLYIKLSIEDPSTLEGPKVFGADLQSILDREQSRIGIPLIVRDSIREIEQRGMSIVGIYRLCGSAIAKRELRKKYESDSKSVDLSQENYPDVNVITGILKDFLRELPQPLFPPELLEAVTIAMEESAASSRVASVSSPFEPTPVIDFPEPPTDIVKDEDMYMGRQSVILNLIEVEKKVTLPPAEKATLYALLNHLKRVAANQDQNKMTCQNLAVCFGPVLLGSINMAPSKGMDLTAAIGFKQHIQVLNFMVSNWPSKPVPLDSLQDVIAEPEKPIDGDSRRASKRMSRVSLTRRISHIFTLHKGSSNSSLSGGVNFEPDCRNSTGKQALSNMRKSGSLTNILESNLDASTGRVFIEDGYFEQDDQDILFQNSEDDTEECSPTFSAPSQHEYS